MLRNYFITAFRSFSKKKNYTFINIIGLAIGLASSFLIFLWVQDEYRTDRFHENGEQLYRALRNVRYSDGQTMTYPAMPKPLAQTLEEEFPEIQRAELVSWDQEVLLANGEDHYRENGNYVGQDFFKMFSFPLVQGDPATVLQDINGIVISETLAQKYFGDQNAVGKVLRLNNQEDMQITGVFQDIPDYSSLIFDFVMPIEHFIRDNDWVEDWGNNGIRLFTMLEPKADVNQVNAKIKDVIRAHTEGEDVDLFLQPYADMHLYSKYEDGQQAGGRITYVQIFSVVAVFMLIIACINFINLATARSAQRAKEVGVRKAIGANKKLLIGQFMAESTLIVLLSLVLAVLLVELTLPFFNQLTNKSILVDYTNPALLASVLGIVVFTGLLAGSYPALFLSSFQPAQVLKGTVRHSSGATLFRKSLVVFQFAVSILLIIGTFVVYDQISYMQRINLGVEKENLAYMPKEGALSEQYETFKQQLLQQPGILSVTASSQNPLDVGHSTESPKWDGKQSDEQISFQIINAGYDFIETMGMQLAAGRDFSPAFSTDTSNYMINEAAAQVMGMDDPVGEALSVWDGAGKIIGVVKDFHSNSLYEEISPLIIRLAVPATSYVFVRTGAGQTAEALAGMGGVSQTINPAYPFEYKFLNQMFQETYQREEVIGTLANLFAMMAILISCLGLLGLASFTAEQRTKEIGVRKVLGASVGHLVMLLSGDFTKLVLLGFLLASPIAYYLMNDWLQGFAYQTELSPGIFLLAGSAALLIAWLTVGYQSVRAARANPVHALRSD